jgi:tRNA threonylcarbamoyladenosine biosynthesis protein TsaB
MGGMREPLILAVETSTRAGSVSLCRGEEVLGKGLGDASASHSTDLIPNIERVLREGDSTLFEIDLFAVAIGPGSFTGLRIGLATVKAFAVCAQKLCAPVSTLAAIAHGSGNSERTVSLLPAGRGEVYAQAFSVWGETVQALDAAAHLKPSELIERYGETSAITCAGEGAHQHFETIRQVASAWSLAPQAVRLADSVAVLGRAAYRRDELVSAEALVANYVRASDAEINERWLKQHS